jgi:hypothetical protein
MSDREAIETFIIAIRASLTRMLAEKEYDAVSELSDRLFKIAFSYHVDAASRSPKTLDEITGALKDE